MVPILTFGMVLHKKTTHIMFIVTVGTLINFVLNLALIPKFGMMGAAVNSIITYLIINFLSYKISQKYFYISFDKLRLLKILIIFLIISILSNLYPFANLN